MNTKAIKAFNNDLTCRDFQYEIGKTYTHEGEVTACESGFHACPPEAPFAVWNYYPPISAGGEMTRYAEVTLGEVKHDGNKLVSASIAIDVELKLPDFIKHTVATIKSLTSGYEAHAATSGNGAHAATSDYRAHAVTSGNGAHAATSDYRAHAATSGNEAHAATSGYEAHAATSGYEAHAATSGNGAHAATSGNGAHAVTSGNGAHAATSGNGAHAATSDYRAHAATSGYGAHAATSGYGAHAVTSGNGAHAATSGNGAHAATSGDQSTAMAAGSGCKVKAKSGGLFAQEWIDGKVASNACGIVGQGGIEPDTWYVCKAGKLVEAAQ